jgi:hypothetical protein
MTLAEKIIKPKLVDGSTLSMPDTKENQEKYPQPKSQKKGIGFPLGGAQK